MEAVEGAPPAARRVEMRRPDVRAEGAQMAEAGVVEDDGDHVGRPCGGLGVVGKAGGRFGRGEADLLRFVHEPRG